MTYELSGTILEIYDTIQRTETFAVREFVVEVTEVVGDKTYSQPVKLQTTNAKAEALDNFSIGEKVNVKFNIRGSKWEKEGKVSYFNNLDAWKIESEGKPEKKNAISEAELVEQESDLPF